MKRKSAEFRVQSSGGGRWKAGNCVAALLALLAAGCASPKPAQFTDAEWVSNTTTGRGAYERGDYSRAEEAFARAQARARALDDANALAVAAANRALCLISDSKAADARAAVDEALADARVSKDRRMELLVAGARADLAAGQADAALDRVAAALKLKPDILLRAQALLVRCGADLAKKDTVAAARALTDGMNEKAWRKLPPSIHALQVTMRGAIAAADQKPMEAMARQDEAAELWKKANRLSEMARSLAEAGRQAQTAGDLAGACDRYYRSARSLWAQGAQPEAAKVLEMGVLCAEQLNDEAVGNKMADLFVTFKQEQRLDK